MARRRVSHHTRGVIALIVFSITSVSILAAKTILSTHLQSHNYSYLGPDYPSTWPLAPLASVHMTREHTIHYATDTVAGLAEWNATMPSGGAVVHLGPQFRPFSLSIFHQLRCLDIIREVLVEFHADNSPGAQFKQPDLARHCMHYLRQMVLCRADIRLESVRAAKGSGMTVWEVTHVCKDWTVVFSAAEHNWNEYLERRKEDVN